MKVYIVSYSRQGSYAFSTEEKAVQWVNAAIKMGAKDARYEEFELDPTPIIED